MEPELLVLRDLYSLALPPPHTATRSTYEHRNTGRSTSSADSEIVLPTGQARHQKHDYYTAGVRPAGLIRLRGGAGHHHAVSKKNQRPPPAGSWPAAAFPGVSVAVQAQTQTTNAVCVIMDDPSVVKRKGEGLVVQ